MTPTQSTDSNQTGLSPWLAAATVFLAACTVLVLEILGARLLAPYVGVTLQTYTATIGTVLAGISAGTWLGGRAADRTNPRQLLGPLVAAGGVLVLLVVPSIDLFASRATSASPMNVIVIVFAALFLPAALLSAIHPTVVKLQLGSLEQTGSIVGRLSAIATAGSLAGTFLTGFVLVGHFRTSAITRFMGVGLLFAGILFIVTHQFRKSTAALTAIAVVGVSAAGLSFVKRSISCNRETPYYCLRVIDRSASEKVLMLDDLQHSSVDLNDPTQLEFWYIKAFAAVTDVAVPKAASQNILSIGGGGLTMPRYLGATRTDVNNTVLEVDPAVIDTNRTSLRCPIRPTSLK